MHADEEVYDENVDAEEEISMEDEAASSPSSRSEHNEDHEFDVRAYIPVMAGGSSRDGAADDAAAEAERVFPVVLSTLS